MPIQPFTQGYVSSVCDHHLNSVLAEIDGLDSEYVLKASPTELENHFLAKASITPLKLLVDEKSIESRKAIRIDVSNDFSRAVMPGEKAFIPGTEVKVAIPYEGDEQLWKFRPSTFTLSGYPKIDIQKDRIVLTLSFADDSANGEQLKKQIDGSAASLVGALTNQSRDVQLHNSKASESVRARLRSKREKALAAVNAIAALGLPMKRRTEPATYIASVTRRPQVTTVRPKVSTEAYQPEPVLSEQEYAHILKVLSSMALVIERNPKSFATLDEEQIRDHFLLQLNGHYEGTASGETFNANGKTDILIRVQDKNVFIAECKFWRGPKVFDETIDQLLGYLSWRDCKCAIMVFNRNRDSSSVLKKMHETMELRTEWRKTLENQGTENRYVFVKQSDPGREIVISTLLFDIPTATAPDIV